MAEMLIDAEVLLKKLSKMIDFCKKDKKVNGLTALFQVGDAIMDCPKVEAKPVVHAHWKEYWDYDYGNYSYCCSNCGKDALTKEGTMYDQVLTELCPYCGAQMDEKEG